MSKLLDRLDRITRGPGRVLGFAPAAQRETVPTLALLAVAGNGASSTSQTDLNTIVDAVILPETANVSGEASTSQGAVWGVEAPQLDKPKADRFRNAGADFLVFDIENTLVEALEEGECARILRVSPSLEETHLRCIEDLPADIIIVSKPSPDGPLSLSHLLAITNVRSAVSRYVLLEWDGELSQRELEQLRDLGIDGIVLTGSNASSLATTLRERINALPPRRPRSEREQRGGAVIPRISGPGSVRQRSEPDEDDDEEDF